MTAIYRFECQEGLVTMTLFDSEERRGKHDRQ
jgi:hypothetical protein